MGSSSKTMKNGQEFLRVLSGMITSIAVTLVSILLFAVLIRFVNISDTWIFPVNQVIKIISLIFGIKVVLKNNMRHGFLKGILIGILYFVVSFFVFGILQGKLFVDFNNFYDLILTTLMGGLIGIIAVNLGKK